MYILRGFVANGHSARLPPWWYNFSGPFYHRWALTSAFMSAISDIWHRHLLFRYRNKKCRTKSFHSEFGRVPISTWASIPISD
jgi:hypothetical protein